MRETPVGQNLLTHMDEGGAKAPEPAPRYNHGGGTVHLDYSENRFGFEKSEFFGKKKEIRSSIPFATLTPISFSQQLSLKFVVTFRTKALFEG